MAYISLPDLPAHLRASEAAARESASEDSGFDIVLRSGWHGQPETDPPVIGQVETLAAAQWWARQSHTLSGQGVLRRYAYRPHAEYGVGTWPSDAPTSDRAAGFEAAARDLETRCEAERQRGPLFVEGFRR